MKRSKKKVLIPELIGRSVDYQDGYLAADNYFEYIVKGGECFGGAPFRVFVEAVAISIRNKELLSNERVNLIDYILKWGDSDFNRGVHDLLVRRANEYIGLKLIEELFKKGDDLLNQRCYELIKTKL